MKADTVRHAYPLLDRRMCLAAGLGLVASACISAPPAGLDEAGTPLRPDALRTPEDRFANLPGYPFKPNYVEIDGYRVHYVDEGDPNADPVLMMHGEPSWSYLYRKMIPIVAAAGHRVIAPDLIGFGRSDKPKAIETHTYAFHVAAMSAFVRKLNLQKTTLVCQDWGSLIGLRVAAENEARFARIVLANGGLPTGDSSTAPQPAFMVWKANVDRMRAAGDMPVANIMAGQTGAHVQAAYGAPFPDPSYKAGPLAMPALVPLKDSDPGAAENRQAWSVYERWTKPFLTAFSDGDQITRGGDKVFQERVPGARGQPHVTIRGAGHFLQETHGEELARIVVAFIASTR
jgi:haloalkane dehalogenase